MFKHEKQLFHPVAVEGPNPHYAGAAAGTAGRRAMVS